MLFNLFGKKDEEAGDHVFIDRAYVSTAAKMKACADLARKQPDTLFLSWFAETASQFRAFFKQEGLDGNLIVDTHYIHVSKLTGKTPVFVEHFPLHTKELELIKNWEVKNIVVYSALDEPLFKHFGSDKIIPLIKMLGMKEDEAIEHKMVTKSIITGQEKIAKLITFEQSAASQEEWMMKNIK
jgi:hypothetical protein